MIVRLKVTLVINEDDFYNGFNSMIVWLKDKQRDDRQGAVEGFNSMIVRLKVRPLSFPQLLEDVSILW